MATTTGGAGPLLPRDPVPTTRSTRRGGRRPAFAAMRARPAMHDSLPPSARGGSCHCSCLASAMCTPRRAPGRAQLLTCRRLKWASRAWQHVGPVGYVSTQDGHVHQHCAIGLRRAKRVVHQRLIRTHLGVIRGGCRAGRAQGKGGGSATRSPESTWPFQRAAPTRTTRACPRRRRASNPLNPTGGRPRNAVLGHGRWPAGEGALGGVARTSAVLQS